MALCNAWQRGITFSSWFNVVSKNGTFPRISVDPCQFYSADCFWQNQVTRSTRGSGLRPGCHVPDHRRPVIECLRPDWKCVSDFFFEIVNEEKSLGHSLFHLLWIIWNKMITIILKLKSKYRTPKIRVLHLVFQGKHLIFYHFAALL